VTRLGLRPYRAGDQPDERSVPVSVAVLTKDEELNIRRCLTSVAWAEQVVVVDSGSVDDTVPIARQLGAEVVQQRWLGFSGQREFALRHPSLRHDWVYFVDADEWVSPELAREIAGFLRAPAYAAFAHRRRLVFQGSWIRHCGWYSGSWLVRLVDRRYAKFDGSIVGETACVDGAVGRLTHDLVDDDQKGLAAWLRKHVGYAELEAQRRAKRQRFGIRLRVLRSGDSSRPLARAVLKDLIFPSIPAKPAALFFYMYVVRLGLLDRRAGLRFCLLHAWHEAVVEAMQANAIDK